MLMDNPHYAASARAIRELHSLIRAGQGDSAEADRIRDESDEHWRYLSLEEIDSLQNLSADLYSIDEQPLPFHIISSELVGELARAIDVGDFDKAAMIVRKPEVKVESTLGAFVRASYWTRHGDYGGALIFLDEALRLDPENPAFHLTRLINIWLTGDERAFDEAAALIDDSRSYEADDVIEIGTVLALSAYDRVRSRRGDLGEFGGEEIRAIEQVSERLHKILTDSVDGLHLQLEPLAHKILGFCHSLLAGLQTSTASVASGEVRSIGCDSEESGLLDQMAELVKLDCKSMFLERISRPAA